MLSTFPKQAVNVCCWIPKDEIFISCASEENESCYDFFLHRKKLDSMTKHKLPQADMGASNNVPTLRHRFLPLPSKISLGINCPLPAVFGRKIYRQRGAETESWRVTSLAFSLILWVCLLAILTSAQAETSN